MDVINHSVRSNNVELWEIGNNSPLAYPQEKVRLLAPFPEYSDSARPCMYHCHILEHEDAELMGQFTVV